MSKYLKDDQTKKNSEIISVIFLVAYYIFPQYFGVHIGFDLTVQRFMVIVFFMYIVGDKKRREDFSKEILNTPALVWMCLYIMVLIYTSVLRVHIGTFMYSFFELVGLYMVVYIVKYCLGLEKTIKILNLFGFILCLLGIVEYVIGRTPFGFMETLNNVKSYQMIRSGRCRIMGPANHALGYGLMLLLMLPLACYDEKTDKINLFFRPFYFLLIIINIFFTGSRSTLAVLMIELACLLLFSAKEYKKRIIVEGIIVLVGFAVFLILGRSTSVGRYILLQITSVIDEVFDTTYSVAYGADITTLSNSSGYREQLPLIFKLDWLNPLIGRGSQPHFGVALNGFFIHSIDNFYVATYIRYAYPGLVTYCMYALGQIIAALRASIKFKSGICLAVFTAGAMYFLNLWWLDGLMTYKYVYIFFAIFMSVYDIKTGEFKLNVNRDYRPIEKQGERKYILSR